MSAGINWLEGRKYKNFDFSTDRQCVSLYITDFKSSGQHYGLFSFYILLSRNPKAPIKLGEFP
jgi:hypothetical protein